MIELFSDREKKIHSNQDEVYIYAEMPEKSQNQLHLIFKEAILDDYWRLDGVIEDPNFFFDGYKAVVPNFNKNYILYPNSKDDLEKANKAYADMWIHIETKLKNEMGELQIFPERDFLHQEIIDTICYSSLELSLDTLELLLKCLYQLANKEWVNKSRLNNLVNKINFRFKKNSLGFRYSPETLQIIRCDSEYIHSEVVKPL